MISVVIVDEKRDVREGLKMILDGAEGFQCKNVYSDGESAIEGISVLHPDVVLMDIELPKMSGIDCIKVLKRTMPNIDIIIFTARTEDESIFQSLRAGAKGYLTKNIFPSNVLTAIKEVKNGGSPMSSYISRRVVSSFTTNRNSSPDLSQREKDVLELLCQGMNYRSIAEDLFISPNTVRFHLKNIYKKLDVNSKYEAVIKASKHGMV